MNLNDFRDLATKLGATIVEHGADIYDGGDGGFVAKFEGQLTVRLSIIRQRYSGSWDFSTCHYGTYRTLARDGRVLEFASEEKTWVIGAEVVQALADAAMSAWER